MKRKKIYKPISILIGFQNYLIIEFKTDGFRILFDAEYVNKFRNYIQSWGLDEKAVFDDIVNDCYNLINGKYNKRNDLPMRFSASSKFGTTINLLNGIKIQFIEDTLFGKEYKSETLNIHVDDERFIHFWY